MLQIYSHGKTEDVLVKPSKGERDTLAKRLVEDASPPMLNLKASEMNWKKLSVNGIS